MVGNSTNRARELGLVLIVAQVCIWVFMGGFVAWHGVSVHRDLCEEYGQTGYVYDHKGMASTSGIKQELRCGFEHSSSVCSSNDTFLLRNVC